MVHHIRAKYRDAYVCYAEFAYTRHIILDIWTAILYGALGVKNEYDYTASDPRADGTVTPEPAGSDCAPLRWSRAFFPRLRQSSSQVRDAACTSSRWTERDRSGRTTWVLASGLLSNYRFIFRCGYAWLARRAAGAPWPAKTHARAYKVPQGSRACAVGRSACLANRTSLRRKPTSTHDRESASLNRCFWPVSEQSQADYERLREAVLSGRPFASAAATKLFMSHVPRP